jgi:hypothetical protein
MVPLVLVDTGPHSTSQHGAAAALAPLRVVHPAIHTACSFFVRLYTLPKAGMQDDRGPRAQHIQVYSGPEQVSSSSGRSFHFLLMMEWLRDFKAAGLDLPPGDQHTTGSCGVAIGAACVRVGNRQKKRKWEQEKTPI